MEKNAVELAKLVRRQLAQPNLRVAVYPTVNGWLAKVYAKDGAGRDFQKRIDDIVQELKCVLRSR